MLRIALCSVLLVTGACRGGRPLYETPAQAERRYLESIRPPELKPTVAFSGSAVPVPVWAYADDGHRRQVQGWSNRLREQLISVNPMLEACCGLRLELERALRWEGDHSRDTAAALEALRQHAPVREHRVVIGLLAPMTFDATDFRVLGQAEAGGRHLVVRGFDDAVMSQQIDRVAPNAGIEARRRLYRAALRHKEQTVLLHEIGHLLDVPHHADPRAIMHGSYSWSVTGFAPDTAMQLAQRREQLTPAGFAAALARFGSVDAADDLFARALEERPDDPELLQRRCSTLMSTTAGDRSTEEWTKTHRACRDAAEATSAPYVAWATARSAIELEQWDAAHAWADRFEERVEGLEAASAAVAAGEPHAKGSEAWFHAAQLRAQLGEVGAARRCLARTDHPDRERVRAWVEDTVARYPDLSTKGRHADADQGRLHRGLRALARGLESQAAGASIAEARRLSDAFANSSEPYRLLCRAWSGGGPDPTSMCRAALQRRPDDTDILYWWAQADLQRQRFDAARRKLEALLRKDPNHADGRRLLSALRGALG